MNVLKLRLLSALLLASLLAAVLPVPQAQAFGIVYRVTPGGGIVGRRCGGNWGAAACTLQSALSLAGAGDEIWVAKGTYKPTATLDRTVSFTLKNGVALYGGFAGNEKLREQRDPAANLTILSGDIGVASDTTDNSYHVVVTSGMDSTAILDGFTITGGAANGPVVKNHDRGAGLLNLSGSPTLQNLIIAENYSEGYDSPVRGSGSGGGMHSSGNPTLRNIIFSRNKTGEAGYGGGLYTEGNPLITDVTFSDNWAGAGGGLASLGTPTLLNVTFSDNEAYNGGGMINTSLTYGTAVLTNVTFSNNSACNHGGALYSIGDVLLTNVTISGNSAVTFDGGGVYQADGILTLRNTILWGNTAPAEPQVAISPSLPAAADIASSVVEGGCPAGAICSAIISADPQLATLNDNGSFTQTMGLLPGSSALDRGSYCPATDQRGVRRPQYRRCDIGAFELLEPVGAGMYDDTDPAWLYNGLWTLSRGTGTYGDSVHHSGAGSYAQVTFRGTQVELTYLTGPDYGILVVSLDGKGVEKIDAYAGKYGQGTWTSPVLDMGVHTIRFEVDYGLSGSVAGLDAIQVSEAVPQLVTYDDSDPAWTFTGSWTVYNGPEPYHRTLHYTDAVGSAAQIQFSGTQFVLTYLQSGSRGYIEVYVDNNLIATIDAFSPAPIWQTTWTSPTLAYGTHTVRFVHAGGGPYIDVDAITIIP